MSLNCFNIKTYVTMAHAIKAYIIIDNAIKAYKSLDTMHYLLPHNT
jgi:hypothetical protein